MWPFGGTAHVVGAGVVSLLALLPSAFSERLPMRIFATADGLAHDRVNRIRRDSQGFIWFCTDDGLSRWNGYEFQNYTRSDGLPHAHINDLLETSGGEYWIATDGGLVQFSLERPLSPFTTYFAGTSSLSRAVNVLAEDIDRTLLLGTGDGLYRLRKTSNGVHIIRESLALDTSEPDGASVNALLVRRDGTLWIGAGSGIYIRESHRQWQHFARPDGLPDDFIRQLREAPYGHVWAATNGGLVQLASPSPAQSIVRRLVTTASGLPGNEVRDFLIAPDGHAWVGTANGLAEGWVAEPHVESGKVFRLRPIAGSGAEQSIICLSEDAQEDLWLGTGQAGAVRLSRSGFHTYAEADGLVRGENNDVFESRNGRLCVVNGDRSRRLIQCFDHRRFALRTFPQNSDLLFGFEWHQFATDDHAGNWWFATERGAMCMPGLERSHRTTPSYFISALALSSGVTHVFEDSRGLMWLAEAARDSNAVVTWNPLTRVKQVVWKTVCAAGTKRTAASCFLEDTAGQIWIGLTGEGGVLRCRGDRFDSFSRNAGMPAGEINDLHEDRAGRLWIVSTEGGLVQMENLTADHPSVRSYNRAKGLMSDEIWCTTSDLGGHIYAGTGRGVDALDPETGQVVHYSADDGLVSGPVRACFCDRRGELWFVTSRGASRFAPGREPPHTAPRVLMTGFRVPGASSGVGQPGRSHSGPFELGPSQNHIVIEFVGLDRRLRGDLRYQYRLLGSDQNWTKPLRDRSITFAALNPQRYRFEVRAIDIYGTASPAAAVEFLIRPPVWRRWWFQSLALLALAALLGSLYRYRIMALLESERIRTRIATDLHDDIGAGLSQIAVLTEVAGQQVSNAQGVKEALSNIGCVSRELAESMNDIVWSVNPQRDYLGDLVQRMRRFSSDVISGAGIDLDFGTALPEEPIPITSDARRHVHLIFKEAVNNLVRHSGCSKANIRLSVQQREFLVQIEDNGSGLAERRNEAGNGLRSMRERAAKLDARIEFRGATGGGLRVILRVPGARMFVTRLRR